MKELDEKMAQVKPDAIISAALSAWALGMRPETMEIIDQIQYMAYDDIDIDGVQSTTFVRPFRPSPRPFGRRSVARPPVPIATDNPNNTT